MDPRCTCCRTLVSWRPSPRGVCSLPGRWYKPFLVTHFNRNYILSGFDQPLGCIYIGGMRTFMGNFSLIFGGLHYQLKIFRRACLEMTSYSLSFPVNKPLPRGCRGEPGRGCPLGCRLVHPARWERTGSGTWGSGYTGSRRTLRSASPALSQRRLARVALTRIAVKPCG